MYVNARSARPRCRACPAGLGLSACSDDGAVRQDAAAAAAIGRGMGLRAGRRLCVESLFRGPDCKFSVSSIHIAPHGATCNMVMSGEVA
jgi:hypothetical protein